MSTPTISRFENGEKNIQLASVLAILAALGMVERPALEFPDKAARFDADRDAVLFVGRAADGEVPCTVTGEALQDHFAARGSSQRARMAAFRANRDAIEQAARRKLESYGRERDGSILVRSTDIDSLRRSG